MSYPVINEYELELVSKVLDITNPGRSEANHIKDVIRSNWPFYSISTGGWVAYRESRNNYNIRIALTPYTQNRYLEESL